MNQNLQPAQDMFTEVAMDVKEGNGAGAQDNTPKLPPSVNVPSNQPNTGASVMNTSTTSPESSGGVKSWLGGVESPTSIYDDAEDGATIISRTKSAGNGSRGSNKAPRNTTANSLSGLNNRLGEIIPIFKDFNSKLNIGLAPPASPVIAPSQTAWVENCSTTSTTVLPIATTSITPPTATDTLQGSLSMQPAHTRCRAAITFMMQHDKYLGVDSTVKLLHLCHSHGHVPQSPRIRRTSQGICKFKAGVR
ncbi:hypothetical protein SERLADRAFT_432538 [Serpula lacrymans var. lacrymans S7.9]|uniref:Uncharacterized protein n=1 Tax=Serpula lacrymans var. lacrymans (strain S7.9) TaxID=578457 RepID=F8NFP6_SERL9|nr:uncharacterized protein SERLADRAFT_432538 [Serpula lacrymans var. lacrymans S7.9]EGO30886.1 hypothetical protein SERLADRAFT_432538 [Serpula lacrymans var. lacrymans S7.9]